MIKTQIAIIGAAGRMGRMTFREVMADETAAVSGMLVRPGSPDEGSEVKLEDGKTGTGVFFTDDFKGAFEASDVVIDFSTREAVMENLALALKTGTAIVIGVTGFTEAELSKIKEAGKILPVLLSYNMSPGINALAASLSSLAASLGPDFHLEITDIHHKNKKDAPSGTALMLGRASGREAGEIKYVSHREGTVVGEHHILFSGPGEQIEIVHKAHDRSLFAKGALMAAHWLKDQGPGFYSMKDVLSL